MGRETPKTCWAIHKRQVINLWNCCILLVEIFELYDDAGTCERQTKNLSYEMASRIATWKHNFIINSMFFPKFYFKLTVFMNMQWKYILWFLNWNCPEGRWSFLICSCYPYFIPEPHTEVWQNNLTTKCNVAVHINWSFPHTWEFNGSMQYLCESIITLTTFMAVQNFVF